MIRRYGLVAYWLLFAVHTLDAAQNPGLVADPSAVPYPWGGVMTTWLILAVETGILYAILRPPTFRGQGTRLGLALLYSFVLLLVGLVTFVTDMPGYVYVPGFFALSTFAALLLLTGGTAAFRLLRPAGPHAEPPAS